MLGEQNHGDGTSFVFKTKLIEYLHMRHGYNVLAFKDDSSALEQAWKRVHLAQDIAEHVKPQIYSVWANTLEVAPLWQFIEKQYASGNPLIVAGIDPRPSGRNSNNELLREIEAPLESHPETVENLPTSLAC